MNSQSPAYCKTIWIQFAGGYNFRQHEKLVKNALPNAYKHRPWTQDTTRIIHCVISANVLAYVFILVDFSAVDVDVVRQNILALLH